MAVKQNLGAAMHAVDALDAFKKAAHSHYKVAYVRLGKGTHAFGHIEFRTREELESELTQAFRTYRLDEKKFSLSVDSTCTLVSFRDKGIYNQFMQAIYYRNERPSNLTVQVANHSREWHLKAGEYLAHANRQRMATTPREDRATHHNVPSFGNTLVNYNFPDIEMMREFCAYVATGQIDRDEAVLKAATQPDLLTHSVRRDIR